MEELKTLKDMNLYKSEKDEIKQEAIKWVKERISNCIYACRMGIHCKEHKFWMKRLDVTEEDLK